MFRNLRHTFAVLLMACLLPLHGLAVAAMQIQMQSQRGDAAHGWVATAGSQNAISFEASNTDFTKTVEHSEHESMPCHGSAASASQTALDAGDGACPSCAACAACHATALAPQVVSGNLGANVQPAPEALSLQAYAVALPTPAKPPKTQI